MPLDRRINRRTDETVTDSKFDAGLSFETTLLGKVDCKNYYNCKNIIAEFFTTSLFLLEGE